MHKCQLDKVKSGTLQIFFKDKGLILRYFSKAFMNFNYNIDIYTRATYNI